MLQILVFTDLQYVSCHLVWATYSPAEAIGQANLRHQRTPVESTGFNFLALLYEADIPSTIFRVNRYFVILHGHGCFMNLIAARCSEHKDKTNPVN